MCEQLTYDSVVTRTILFTTIYVVVHGHVFPSMRRSGREGDDEERFVFDDPTDCRASCDFDYFKSLVLFGDEFTPVYTQQ